VQKGRKGEYEMAPPPWAAEGAGMALKDAFSISIVPCDSPLDWARMATGHARWNAPSALPSPLHT
jgi:hypothetical protein